MNRADKQPAYLLHKFPFSESSLIGYFFTREYGVVHLMMKGARKNKRYTGLLQPAQELFIAWSGRTELKTLCDIWLPQGRTIYAGKTLIILMYINELLHRLLKPFDAHTQLYDKYHAFLTNTQALHSEATLRNFEYALFAEIGYGLSFKYEGNSKNSKKSIDESKNYIYEPGKGFRISQGADGEHIFPGRVLLAIGQNNFTDPHVLRTAKSLNRLVLHHLLDGKVLISRSLFGRPKDRAAAGRP